MEGPQLAPEYYEYLGEVRSSVDNLTVFENRCKGAIELLRVEARQMGADALINVSCGRSMFGAGASGKAIIFKDRDECMKILKEIGAYLL